METFLIVLIMIALIGLSNVLHRFIPFIPIPLIQIAAGVLLALIPGHIHLPLDPELFLVLFIAPLLFNDGKRFPRGDLWKLRAPILMLALGLVFVTVLVAGYSIHAMIPSITLPAAFALAAVLSPTDAVAVSALSSRVHLPKTIHRVLEGEALMNDASGLVAFKFAIAAAVTGVFSLPRASLSFLIIAVGGLLAGAIAAGLIIRLGFFIRRLGMEDETIHTLLQIMTPFFVYLICEEIGVSGILGVVAAGLIHAIERDRAISPHYKLQIVSASTWSVLLFILNGLVFVILGFSIPDVMKTIFLNDAYHNGLMIGYIFAITLLLIVLRFIWISLFTHFRRKKEPVTFKAILLTSISGVRGAVTLAGAFSIPLTVMDGSAFPGRDLMIFLASGVILLSLLIASIFLPLLAKKPQEAKTASPKQAERAARERVIQAGVQILQTAMTEETRETVGAAIEEFKQNAGKLKRESEKGRGKRHLLDNEVRLAGIQAERKELDRLLQAKAVSPATAEKLTELFNHTEVVLARRIDAQFRLSLGELRRFFGHLFARGEDTAEGMEAGCNLEELRRAKLATAEAAYEAIRSGMTDRNRLASEHVLFRYRQIINRLKRRDGADDTAADILAGKEEQRLSLNREAIQEQRNTVQEMFEDGTISRELAGKLRQFVAELEASLLKEE